MPHVSGSVSREQRRSHKVDVCPRVQALVGGGAVQIFLRNSTNPATTSITSAAITKTNLTSPDCLDRNFATSRGSVMRPINPRAHKTMPGKVPVTPGGIGPNKMAIGICVTALSAPFSGWFALWFFLRLPLDLQNVRNRLVEC